MVRGHAQPYVASLLAVCVLKFDSFVRVPLFITCMRIRVVFSLRFIGVLSLHRGGVHNHHGAWRAKQL